MKLLGLFRHAKSNWSVTLRDFDRGLNPRGRRGATLMGDHIRGYRAAWDGVIGSPAERVRRTLEIAGLDKTAQWEPRAYLADESVLLNLLRTTPDDFDSLLIAGHNPGLQELIFTLVGPHQKSALFDTVADKYPTATFAALELRVDRWADCAPGCGTLVHLARPRDLDPNLGPLETE